VEITRTAAATPPGSTSDSQVAKSSYWRRAGGTRSAGTTRAERITALRRSRAAVVEEVTAVYVEPARAIVSRVSPDPS
jgi:hypothetical protein